MVGEVHKTAMKGFTAESAAKYDAGRPSYPAESLDRILEIMFSAKMDSDHAKVLELGAGTGKFTDSFLSYARKSGVSSMYPVLDCMEYIATEPSEGFRETLTNKLSKFKSVVKVDHALGTSIPVPDNSLDAVIVAQAFHWMATVDTLREVHRVLIPYCPLVMIWNSYDYSYDWMRQIDEKILTPAYGEGVPRQQNGKWEECFTPGVNKPAFSLLSKWQGQNVHVGDEETVVNRIMSTSVIVEKSAEDRAEVEKTLRAILATHPELEEARRKKRFEISYITEIAWVVKHEVVNAARACA